MQSTLDLKASSTTMTTSLALKADQLTTYNKTDVDGKFTVLLSGVLDALNALNELSAALGADPNFSATIDTQLGQKQDKFIQGNFATDSGAGSK